MAEESGKKSESCVQNEREVEEASAEVQAALEKKACCCGGLGHKERPEAEKTDLIHRLNRIEGQIRGIRRMVEEGDYCVDILTQVSATSCALNSFTKELLANHIKTCVADDIREGNEEKVDELVKVLQRMLK